MRRFSQFTLVLALLAPQLGQAEDNEWITPSNGQKMAEAMERVQDNAPTDIQLKIDIRPRPEDNGGNLFLVGFEQVDEHGMPIADAAPSDFKQLGIWVKKWPFVQEVELLGGLHYMALYGYSEYPSPNDSISRTASPADLAAGELNLLIEPVLSSPKGTPPDQGDGESKSILPSGLQEQPVTLTIQIETPPEDNGGTVFLTGFSDFDAILRMPNRNSDPEHFLILQSGLQEFPLVVETQLKPDFAYFAMLGSGNHPEPGDKMSHAVVFEGGDSLAITIGDQVVGQPPPGAEELQKERPTTTLFEDGSPSDPQSQKTRILLAIGVLGALGGWILNQRSKNAQGIRSRLERVGESDKSS
jgi:hypothetical protein